ncbi:DNA polymerase zeta subunit [Cryptococcus wingfieldii CBS 7118]|uniref:DNA polymerase n=1 Tax=Cryptococcus wingfieldii CBS 7118 TaxID=1295528 RepID=A0A1E3JC83_9TREE|nr:DNA polymerase zeta subunit [Cryptococcus wingfieldii CBS 7118]ODN98467.1 DNA polymerase zeta subunit [Cryptococcus wingfieldii CBS 7118]
MDPPIVDTGPSSSPLFASTQPPTPSNPLLRIRINNMSSEQGSPIYTLRQHYVPTRFATAVPVGVVPHTLPVIRIFGTTPSLQKVCANIHLCYPYFYVPFPMDSSDPLRPERVVKLCQRFAVSLNHAICLALRQNPSSMGNSTRFGGGVDPKHLHVVSVMLVKGTPFYGYHMGYSYYMKVSLANPARMYVALEQLRKPNVLGREWQPHEAHLNHVLQFMCDFDLYGCGWLDLAGGTFREPVPEGDPYESPPNLPRGTLGILNSLTIPDSMFYAPGLSPSKESYTGLEIDILPHQILNRQRLTPRLLHHDFVELLRQPLDPSEKLVPAVAELWEDERRRRLLKGLSIGTAEMMPKGGGMDGRSKEELGYKVKKEDAATEEKPHFGGDWKISEELWEILEERMAGERKKRGPLTFEKFAQKSASGQNGEKLMWDKWIMTTFEAVSALWPKQPRKIPRQTPKSKTQFGSVPPNTASSPTRKARFSEDDPDVAFDVPESSDRVHEDLEWADEDEEANPFEVFAMTQASQQFPPQPELSQRVQPTNDQEDDEHDLYYPENEDERAGLGEGDDQMDAKQAKVHAEETEKIRATQMPAPHADGDDYDDEEMDDIFRQTVAAGLGVESTPTTPNKGSRWAGWTPTKRSGSSTVDAETRKRKRDQVVLDNAGLGDLSTIFDRSSVFLSPFKNPYDDRPQAPSTPTRAQSPATDLITPNSLIRNMFARNRQPSPFNSPSRRKTPTSRYNTADVITLPESKKTPGPITSSPEEEVVKHGKTPFRPSLQQRLAEESQKSTQKGKAPTQEEDDLFFGPDLTFEQIQAIELSLPPAGGGLYEPPRGTPARTAVPTTNAGNRVDGHNERGNATTQGVTKQQASKGQDIEPTMPGVSPTFKDSISSHEHSHPSIGSQKELRPRKRVKLDDAVHEIGGPSPKSNSRPSQSTGISSSPCLPTMGKAWRFHLPPPTSEFVVGNMEEYSVSSVDYQEPFYSDPGDIPKPKILGGRMFSFKSDKAEHLEDFKFTTATLDGGKKKRGRSNSKEVHESSRTKKTSWKAGWEYSVMPPNARDVVAWCDKADDLALSLLERKEKKTSQLVHPTQKNKYGVKFSQKKKARDASAEAQNMTVLSLEVFAQSRNQLLPDPEKDPVTAIFYCYQNEDDNLPDTTVHPGYYAGYVVIGELANPSRFRLDGVAFDVVESELDLINWVTENTKYWDPDVLAGWELHNSSWGYLAARAHHEFGADIMDDLSRVVSGRSGRKNDGYAAHHSSTFKVAGRHTLNIWRICRSEINLTQYNFENVVFHLLHQRIPHYSSSSLTAMWKSQTPAHASRVLKYFFQRAVINVEIIDQAEIITKTAEFARVFGVDFTSVMTRGSQYKVESFMFRIAKPESFVLVTPSKQQVGLQNAPFAVPLIAEPESKYYTHPIIVLDFQSLYPSIMIAYNLCYSTCLGRVEKFKNTNKFGFTDLKISEGLLELLKDYVNVTPNGMIFVKPAVRKSLLAKMLTEMLDTRVMIKQAMKGARGDKSLTSMLNARQLGLKLMANVTYGYTSATYSGRMPCIEVADSIVQTGRETLEKAQELIHSRPDWDARVVYGDTDSLFVALPGRSKDQAFKIGFDIAEAVTAMNPKPVTLKFEKVYMGSVLMAKKRYVGFKYENPDDVEPVFDAKGIETIRRDGFPAQQKMEEVCLKLLFRTQDLSQIKDFCRQEWTKILQGRVSIQDFVIAKEVKLGTYSEKGVPPPGAAVAYRRILKDPRDEPQYAERVPYLISNADGRRLIDRARMPHEMLSNRSLGIDAEYYIRNLLIPPLSRIFNLVGADVEEWYDTMPRTKRAGKYERDGSTGTGRDGGPGRGRGRGRGRGKRGRGAATGSRIDSHFKSSHCIVCGGECLDALCVACRDDPSTTSHTLLSRQYIAETKLADLHRICASCSDVPPAEKILCDSTDCPITYARVAADREMEDQADIGGLVEELSLEDEKQGTMIW